MSECDTVLTQAAKEGTLPTSQWPTIFEEVLQRLEHNVYNVFPIPSIQLPSSAPPVPSNRNTNDSTSSETLQAPPSSPPEPQSSPRSPSHTTQYQVPLPPNTLPPPLLETLNFILNSLRTNFAEKPPHTIQRLAELILEPKQHHRFLYSYISALDRVVCVSSPLDVFPLPVTELPNGNGSTTNGPLVNGTGPSLSALNTSSDDDTLGGALLTPIPWLRRGQAEDDGDHASPSPITSPLSARGSSSPGLDEPPILTPTSEDSASLREHGAMTQGELIRAEQQAGSLALGADAVVAARATSPNADEELPHARGPDAIGMEDTGQTQLGKEKLDMEAAVGRRHGRHGSDGANDDVEMGGDEGGGKSEQVNEKDRDGDVKIVDVDGRTEEDKDKHGEGEPPEALAVDNTAG